MTLLKNLVPVLAAAGFAAAQGPCGGTATIQNAGDASALSACETFSGDIVIATGTTDNIALDGIQTLDGSLRATGVENLTQISSSTLEIITDTFELKELQILSTMDFPRLSNVDKIKWEALPALQQLTFTSGVNQASTVDIQNTLLNSLSGISLDVVDRLILANNRYLQDVSLPLKSVREAFNVEANGADLVVDFPELAWAFNMTMRNCSDIRLPALQSINGSMGVYSGSFETFMGPNLTTVGQSLSFVNNDQLVNISLPQLTKVNGGFQIANNTNLETIDGFPALETVGGALDFNGKFSTVDLPALNDVRGAFNLQSTEDISVDCDRFQDLAGTNKEIKGKFTCAGKQENPGGEGTTPSKSKDSKPNAASSPLQVSSVKIASLAMLVATLLGLL